MLEMITDNKWLIGGVVGVGALLFLVSKNSANQTDATDTTATSGLGTNQGFAYQTPGYVGGDMAGLTATGSPFLTGGSSTVIAAGTDPGASAVAAANIQAEADKYIAGLTAKSAVDIAGINANRDITVTDLSGQYALGGKQLDNAFALSALDKTNQFQLESKNIDLSALKYTTDANVTLGLDANKTSMLVAQGSILQSFMDKFKDTKGNTGGVSANFENGNFTLGWLTKDNTQSVLAPTGNDTRKTTSNVDKTIASKSVGTVKTLNKLPAGKNVSANTYLSNLQSLLGGA